MIIQNDSVLQPNQVFTPLLTLNKNAQYFCVIYSGHKVLYNLDKCDVLNELPSLYRCYRLLRNNVYSMYPLTLLRKKRNPDSASATVLHYDMGRDTTSIFHSVSKKNLKNVGWFSKEVYIDL